MQELTFKICSVIISTVCLSFAAGNRVMASEAFTITDKNCKKAAAFSAQARGLSMLVMQNGKVIFEDYPNGHSASEFHELASGTKSFSGVAALAASEDGILKLDEKVSSTITEWQGDRQKENITIRQLLSLISGIGSVTGMAPTYAEAIRARSSVEPGEKFQYGPAPFQIFGELMVRKLKKNNETMVDYLTRRVLSPAGIDVGKWRNGRDGMPLIPQGAQFTAREWGKFGQFILNGGKSGNKEIIKEDDLKTLFVGSSANPMYGLSWWLNRPVDESLRNSIRLLSVATDLRFGASGLPDDLVMAAGAGKQRLYIVPSLKLVVVRQADANSDLMAMRDGTKFSDLVFWQLLTLGRSKESSATQRQAGNQGQPRAAGAAGGGKLMRLFDRNHDGVLDDQERQNLRNALLRRR